MVVTDGNRNSGVTIPDGNPLHQPAPHKTADSGERCIEADGQSRNSNPEALVDEVGSLVGVRACLHQEKHSRGQRKKPKSRGPACVSQCPVGFFGRCGFHLRLFLFPFLWYIGRQSQ